MSIEFVRKVKPVVYIKMEFVILANNYSFMMHNPKHVEFQDVEIIEEINVVVVNIHSKNN